MLYLDYSANTPVDEEVLHASAKLSGATRATPTPTIRQALPQRLL